MIDPTQKMYDSYGREWVALRMPDGSVYKYGTSYLITSGGSYIVASGKGEILGLDYRLLSNTKPQKDCTVKTWVSFDGDDVSIELYVHRRNGVITAEIVND